jgi:hypothetical protein
VDVVPTSLAGADDGDVLAGEDELGELVDLAASGVDGAASVSWSMLGHANTTTKPRALTVNCRGADDVSLDHIAVLDTSLEHDLVNIAVESRIWQAGELVHTSPVVVFLVGPLAESFILTVFPGQDTSAAGVQPVAGLLLGVAGANTLGDGFGSTLVVRGIGGVCLEVNLCRNLLMRVAVSTYAKQHRL